MTNSISDAELILREFERLPLRGYCPRTAKAAMDIVRRAAQQRITLSASALDRAEQESAAKSMLASGYSFTTTRHALQERFGLSKSTAYRRITAVLIDK